ncbi:uracil-DNA glycosylase [Devosia pacifica]|uniref:Type-4 uracil-DNA glycosylase n=1 Tax=Devosia pacifica TaxID=1335967 RepID=A0A918S7E1_9HYPH|nr:UdgX family uracil-DNA binding protein [Devosia pacifica]GHA28260.1 uracil-DNA glycosylase [Devosia pacifica]
MATVILDALNDVAEWRQKARQLLLAGIAPVEVRWRDPHSESGLFEERQEHLLPVRQPVRSVPAAFLELAEQVVCHTAEHRFDLLYRFLWRLVDDRGLMEAASDPDLAEMRQMASAVRRDSHKMKAFVRFRTVSGASAREQFMAWFEPSHYVLERTAPFFMRRFASMDWAIVTPYRSARWDGQKLQFGPGGKKSDVPSEDAMEEAWKTYYASIFNPARLKVAMMKSEMPVKYWRNLPEAELIVPLVRNARAAENQMVGRAATQPPSRHARQLARQVNEAEAPSEADIASPEDARAAISGCRRCGLYEHATQAVFGEGPQDADIVFVGEQPGDQEDLQGRPFVGPAGQLFDEALVKVGINRERVYVTNAVKHFKFTPRGKRRIHQKPDGGEVSACRFWLDLERSFLKPRITVALGATAAHSLFGKTVTISKSRGQPITDDKGDVLFVTNHPSYLLRIPDKAAAAVEREKFEADLAAIRDYVSRAS